MTKEMIQSAKYADLPSVLQSMGVDLVTEGKSFYLREHDSLKFFRKNDIWLYKWWSRCGEVGDGIQFLMNHCGKKFREAVIILSGQQHQNSSKQNSVESRSWKPGEQASKFQKLVQMAKSKLFEPNGKKSISYLIHERGLLLNTIRKYHLGWLHEWKHMPSKLVIPCYRSNGDLIRIRFRVDNPVSETERYRVMWGSNASIPFTSGIFPDKPVIFVESELDAILIAQEAGSYAGVLALGTTGTKLTPAMIQYLNKKIPITLLCLDNDDPGREKTAYLIKILQNAYNWPVPEKYGKDPGEAWKWMKIKTWVLNGLKVKERRLL